jgi:hypothetical protein
MYDIGYVSTKKIPKQLLDHPMTHILKEPLYHLRKVMYIQ